jgi:GxxExxY protein
LDLNGVTEKIIGCAFKVGNTLGVGFLEAVYENALVHELRKTGLLVEQQKMLEVWYDAEVLNVKILRIVSKLCIGIGDTKFDQLMTLFSIDNGFYLGKTQRL